MWLYSLPLTVFGSRTWRPRGLTCQSKVRDPIQVYPLSRVQCYEIPAFQVPAVIKWANHVLFVSTWWQFLDVRRLTEAEHLKPTLKPNCSPLYNVPCKCLVWVYCFQCEEAAGLNECTSGAKCSALVFRVKLTHYCHSFFYRILWQLLAICDVSLVFVATLDSAAIRSISLALHA